MPRRGAEKREEARFTIRLDSPEFRALPAYIAAHYPGLTQAEGMRQVMRDGLAAAAADPDRVVARRAAYISASREIREALADALRKIADEIVRKDLSAGKGVVFQKPTEIG